MSGNTRDLRSQNVTLKQLRELCKTLSTTEASEGPDALLLSDNNIDDEGALLVAEMLQKNSRLKRVVLNNNVIGDKGCAALASALQFNNTLENLSLYHNKITDAGVLPFASFLQRNSMIKHLNLGENSITDNGAAPVAFILSETSLSTLYLADNLVSEGLLKEINEVLLLRRVKKEAAESVKKREEQDKPNFQWYLVAMMVGLIVIVMLNLCASWMDMDHMISHENQERAKLALGALMPLIAIVHMVAMRSDTSGVMASATMMLVFLFIWFLASLGSQLRMAAKTACLAGGAAMLLRIANNALRSHLEDQKKKHLKKLHKTD